MAFVGSLCNRSGRGEGRGCANAMATAAALQVPLSSHDISTLACPATRPTGEIVETYFSPTHCFHDTHPCSLFPAAALPWPPRCRDLPSIESFAHTRFRPVPAINVLGRCRHGIASSNVLQSLSRPGTPADDCVGAGRGPTARFPCSSQVPLKPGCAPSQAQAHRRSRNQTQNSPSSPPLLWSSVVGGWVRFVSARLLISSHQGLSSVPGTRHLWALRQHLSRLLDVVTSVAYPEPKKTDSIRK